MATSTNGSGIGERARIFTDASAYADFDGWNANATELRDEGAVLLADLPDRTPFWAVLRHAEVMEVERNPDIFTNEPMSTYTPVRPDPWEEREPAAVKTLINMDGDDHRMHRGLISDWFKPGSVKKLNDRIEELSKVYVDRMAEMGGECDFASDIAMHYPLHVILSILGLPESDYERMLRLTQELFGGEDPDFSRGLDDNAMAVILDFVSYFGELTADRRAHPTEDLASVVANATLNGEPLPDLVTFGYYIITATAGHDTTSSAVAGGLWTLLQHPEQLARLQAEPELINNAADEIVRWISPVKHFMRTAQQDYTLGGQDIARGDWLLLSYPSANRDERVFQDPFTFDIARPDADLHLGFGFGRHFCLGAHLARLEIRAFFRELIGRLESIELAGEAKFMHSNLVTGPKTLPVRYRFAS
ncbi:MAG: cytochrome P450 [Acidimicrobiales bacterium]|nr:cytochrome P450 [Acidimicrobiales bacterium]